MSLRDARTGCNLRRFSSLAWTVWWSIHFAGIPMRSEAAVNRQEALSPQSMIVVPNTPEHPRNGEADILRLKNGDLLLGYGRWEKEGSDFGRAEIWCKTSRDGGKTWGDDRVLVPNEGKVTTFEVGLLRLRSGEILMTYCVKDSTEDCSVCFRKSLDEGRTWTPRVKYTIPSEYTGYTAINNNRLIQLKNGRLLLAAYDGYIRGRIILSFVIYSDDKGETWRKSSDVDVRALDPKNTYGADEPAVIELKDGRVMMIVRTDLGYIARSYSRDHGATWSLPEPVPGLIAPNSPASIARLPKTGHLLLIWNNNRTARNPLNSALSKDEGKTWQSLRTVEWGAGGYCYTSITPVGDRLLLTYYAPGGLKLNSIPYQWFYQKEAAGQLTWLTEGPVSPLESRRGWRLSKQGCVYIQDRADLWEGSEDSEVEATILLHSLLPEKRATAMLWVGDAAANASCALYLRAGEKTDSISFNENMQSGYDLGDSGKAHTYRLVTNHQTRTVEVWMDASPEAVLSTSLGAVLGEFNLNRILYGDPNVDFLGGESELFDIRWKNGPRGTWSKGLTK
ncbi:MAG: exo-alpha-sialidase [Armatimonadetes bacterium]|nr:exo-alpha-sialidase [Armatimonadota bacterium]